MTPDYCIARLRTLALRHIVKRNKNLHGLVVKTAGELKITESKLARWIGADALRDLASPATLRRVGKKG